MDTDELIKAALDARLNAHAPYSRFRVGAALLTRDGTVYAGCNVENASYGLTNCAERTAFFAAIADGRKPGDFERIAIVADTEAPISPCGACRQVMMELGGAHLEVIQTNLVGSISTTTAIALLPGSFTLDPDRAIAILEP
ncbi:cytidine deaminase [soil metagenome]